MRNIKHIKDLARLDICREKRSGIPEVILALGKEPKSVAKLLINIAKEKGKAIATRVDKNCLAKIRKKVPPGYRLKHFAKARMVVLIKRGYKDKEVGGKVGIIAAGTSDILIAEEAKATCEELGCEVIYAYDV